ncbi:uncharacterized protein ARMOST_20395 [Armillaria ostoyae]|uniref:Uncharacterized protein n=1 Tax=Armillaria ostoyae TaxID=47428 RepID=A0A284S782_ARMOS|nr:uncharacterized protein ARMOST_20395 [Armillaria ostoyae]
MSANGGVVVFQDLDVVSTPHTQDATFTPIPISTSLVSVPPIKSTDGIPSTSDFVRVSACTPSVVPTIPTPVDPSLNVNLTPSGLLSSGSSPIFRTAPSGVDNPADSIVPPVESLVDNEAVHADAIAVFRRLLKVPNSTHNSSAVDNLFAVAKTMDASDRAAARQEAGEALWSQFVFRNIRKTKTWMLKGCRVANPANPANIAGWDLVPTAADAIRNQCTRCGTLYPCEYTTEADITKCPKCKINVKSCSWANIITVIHDSDSDSEQSVFDALTPNDDGECHSKAADTTISTLSSKRIREQTVEDDTRPKKNRKVESSDRVTRSQTSMAKKPVPSPRAVHFSVSKGQPNEPLDELSDMDGESSMRKHALLQESSNKIPTVTLRRFLPPGGVDTSTPASSDPTTRYSLPPMAVEDMLDQASESLGTERIIEEVARIVADRAEICNNLESLERNWNQNERMQEEIFELVIDRFTSFQEKLVEEALGIKRKWQGGE